jgi:hypothetical protein
MSKKRAALILGFMLVLLFIKQDEVFAKSNISIDKKEATIWVNNYVDLKVTGSKGKAIWNSSDTNIATVSSSGKVTGVSAGTATITATVSQKMYTCAVTIKQENDTSCLQAFLDDILASHDENDINSILGINYKAIKGYEVLDINNDGVKEVLLKIRALWNSYTVYICSVKDGAVTLVGDLALNDAYFYYDKEMYYNKKYNEIVVYGDNSDWDKTLEYYWAFYINNNSLNQYDSRFVARSGDEYLQYSMLNSKEIENKDYKKIINKYYNRNDMTKLFTTGSIQGVSSDSDLERKTVVEYAMQAENTPYVWGGNDLSVGVDCSGLVQAIYKKVGYVLPGKSSMQEGICEEVWDELLPGDLIFYSNGTLVNHVGIYIGGNKIIHAKNAREGVVVDDIDFRKPARAGRVISDFGNSW